MAVFGTVHFNTQMMMLIEALDGKDNIDDCDDNNHDDDDNIDDDGDNNDDDDGEGRLVAVLGTVHLPSTTFHCFLCTTALLSHNATLQHCFLCTKHHYRATMHHNAPLSEPQCNTGRKCSRGFL